MKTITLKQNTLLNFKGAKDLTVNFNTKETNIFGDNGTLKTTIFDAICYILFGKDSLGKSDFNIKTLDENNQVIWKLPHEVSAIIYENETEIILKKCFVERWEVPTGKTEEVFRGHTTDYYVHGNKVPKNNYEQTVSSIIDEKVFKLVTNPLYFNSKDFKLGKLSDWEARREYIFKLADNITDEDIAKGNDSFENVLAKAKESGMTLDIYRKTINSNIVLNKPSVG